MCLDSSRSRAPVINRCSDLKILAHRSSILPLLMGVLFGAWGFLLATPLLAGSIVLINEIYIREQNGGASAKWLIFLEVLRCPNPFLHFPTRSSGANCFRRWYANYLIDHSVRWSLRVLVLLGDSFWGAANGSAPFWPARMLWVFVRLSGEPPQVAHRSARAIWLWHGRSNPTLRILEET